MAKKLIIGAAALGAAAWYLSREQRADGPVGAVTRANRNTAMARLAARRSADRALTAARARVRSASEAVPAAQRIQDVLDADVVDR